MTNVTRTPAFLYRFLAVCCLGFSFAALTEAATIRAYIQPEKARPNQQVSFIITIQDGQLEEMSDRLQLPLQIQQATNASTSRKIEIVNGRQSSEFRVEWGLLLTEPGEFVIPPQAMKVNGEMVSSNEVKIKVEQGEPLQSDDGNQIIMQLEPGKKEIYQGEVMPLLCTLYVPRQTAVRRPGLVEIEKNDFAIARFPQQSDQTLTMIDGVGYVVLTYRSTLSSLKTGDFKIGPASMELLVEVPVEGNQRANRLPPGFPPGFFGMQTEPRKVVVKSQQVSIKVLPLPAEGRPANFSGAVGDFALSAAASPTELTVGDPVAVEMVVQGTGNFDALTTPVLTAPSGWKTYPAKRYSIEGQLDQNQVPTLERKIGYSQVFIPEAVHQTLPPFEINYFSASKKQYVSLRTESIPLNMKPAPAAATVEAAPGGVAGEAAALPPPVLDPQPDITDIVINPPATSRWLLPTGALLLRSTTFWSVQAVPVGLLLLASFLAIVRRRQEARRAGRAGEIRTAWAAMDSGPVSDTEFLRRAAQFIQTAKANTPVTEPELKNILERYQTSNFTAVPAEPVTAEERRKISSALKGLYHETLAKVSSLILLCMLACGSVWAQSPASASSPDDVYKDAVAEMEKGSFPRAQYLAESLTKKKPPQLSAEVFQLIGHARYRQQDLGRAVLWYQRAQLFDPRNPELRQNLSHLHERLRFLSFQPTSPFTQWSLWLSPNEWLMLAAIGGWMVLLSITWRIVAGRRAATWAVVISVLGLLLAVPASAFAALRPPGEERVRDISVVTAPEVRAYTAATVTAGTVIDLPPGSQARVLEKRGSWLYVEVPNQPENLRGWVESAALTPLWIWDDVLVP